MRQTCAAAALLCIMLALIAGCAPNKPTPVASTLTTIVITATLPPTAAVTSSPEAVEATPVPPSTPIPGTTTTQLYLRGEPSSATTPLAIIGPSVSIQITGKDPSGNWYQIQYPQGKDGKGWVSAQYVQALKPEAIPVINGAEGGGTSGAITQQVNVRSGPGESFDVLGILNAKDVVTLTGKDQSSSWLQIRFATGPEGKGWVAAAYVESAGMDQLPIIGTGGQVVGTSTTPPTGVPPTATITAAADDGDSADAPGASVTFSPTGTRTLIYSSDLSSPEGDAADWIAFTPYETSITIRIECAGNGQVSGEILRAGNPIPAGAGLRCGDTLRLEVLPGQTYLLHLTPVAAAGQLQYVRYSLTIAD